MISIKLSTNAKEVETALMQFGADITNFTPVLKRSGELMVKSIQQNFLSQGRPSPWVPLSPMTIAMRRKGTGTGSPKILMDTGALFRSIWYDVNEEEGSVRIGPGGLPYAKKLHFGGINKIPAHTETVKSHTRKTKYGNIKVVSFKRKMPARTFTVPPRPYVRFDEEDIPALQEIFIDFIKKSKENIK